MTTGVFTAINNSTGTLTVTGFDFTNASQIQHVADLTNFNGNFGEINDATVSKQLQKQETATFSVYYNTTTNSSGTYLGTIAVTAVMVGGNIETQTVSNFVYQEGSPPGDGGGTPPVIDYGGGDGGATGAGCAPGTASNSCSASGSGSGDGGSDCFIANTLVEMADGTKKPIVEVKVGDQVYNWNHTAVNTVKFIEKVLDSCWEQLYTPTPEYEPFATIHHPIMINGQLCAPDPQECYALYPWLGEIKQLPGSIIIPAKGEIVYNLWVDGDGTYTVNGFGTTSIMFDGGCLSRCTATGLITEEEAMDIFHFVTSKDKHTQYGGYLANALLGRINLKLMDRFFSWGLKRGKIFRPIFRAFCKTLGLLTYPIKKS